MNNKKHTNTVLPAMSALLISLLILSGCSAGGINIRATDNMLESNPVNKIALFGEGKVNWPLFGNKGGSIIVSTSKESLKNTLSMTKQVLNNKGYEVITSEPIGIGYNSKGWWLVDDSVEETEKKLIEDSSPIFLYQEMEEEKDTTEAARNIVDEFERALMASQLDSFSPPQGDVEIIQKHTDADTICFVRVYGVKYTDKRRAGALGMTILAGMVGAYGTQQDTTDKIDIYYVFIDANTSDVIWQHGEFMPGDPIIPDEKLVAKVLNYFPEKDQPMNKESCKRMENGLLQCKVVSQKSDENNVEDTL